MHILNQFSKINPITIKHILKSGGTRLILQTVENCENPNLAKNSLKLIETVLFNLDNDSCNKEFANQSKINCLLPLKIF